MEICECMCYRVVHPWRSPPSNATQVTFANQRLRATRGGAEGASRVGAPPLLFRLHPGLGAGVACQAVWGLANPRPFFG